MTLLLSILLFLAAPAPTPASKPDAAAFKLKPGAEGKLCLQCHTQFTEVLAKPHVHTPAKGGDCVGCHNPHAASHGKLLSSDKSEVCLSCHKGLVPKQAKSTHKPVAEGACVSCHDPHASDNDKQLIKPGAQLCAGCHQGIADGAAAAKVKHQPVEKGCTTCHDPHGSAKSEHLLTADVPALCTNCHKTSAPQFAKAHLGYPVGKARCTTCHDPHGSNQAGMLYDNVHAPVAKKSCGQCHEGPGSAEPFATKRVGLDLCRSCHGQAVANMLDQPQVHWAIADQRACLNCHSPHASKNAKLVTGNMNQTCGTCHADTIARQTNSPSKHKPMTDGNCTACHDPHASKAPLLFTEVQQATACSPCHDNMKHSSHPMGEKIKDPRNKNLTVACLSCHRAHGTEYKKLMPSPTTSELCVKCHEQFRR